MEWFSSASRAWKIFEQPVSKAAGAFAKIFSEKARLDRDESRVLALLKTLLPQEESMREKALARLRSKLEEQGTDNNKVREIMRFMESAAPGTPEEALPVLKTYERRQQTAVLENFLLLAVERGEYRAEALENIRQIALELEVAPDEFDQMAQTVLIQCVQRTKILKSGTGIILALIVILLFILTATWLSSLLFGLMLAYLFLPMEQALERHLFPLKKAKNKETKKRQYKLSEEELTRRAQQVRTNKATALTVSIVAAAGAIIVVAFGMLVYSYLGALRNNVENWMQKQQSAVVADNAGETLPAEVEKSMPGTEESAPETTPPAPLGFQQLSNSLAGYTMQLQERFQEQPWVQNLLLGMHSYFASGEAQRNLWSLILRKSGGFIGFFTKLIGKFAALLLNILLTFFFFSLLLNKLAMFVKTSEKAHRGASSYLIHTIFNGHWLPAMSETDLANGDRIIGESISKIRVWLRGYLTMVLIDMCVYTTIFYFLDVPYFGILGIIAGFGILLPYIGPVSSALLTVGVTLLTGQPTGMQILGIVLTYSLYNGVIEQFFSYPYFIGDKLGLTTLETIIVVLLGGILAGIPGMIFALPAAAVLKYLVPQIYRCWK